LHEFQYKKWGSGETRPLSKKVGGRRPPASPPHYTLAGTRSLSPPLFSQLSTTADRIPRVSNLHCRMQITEISNLILAQPSTFIRLITERFRYGNWEGVVLCCKDGDCRGRSVAVAGLRTSQLAQGSIAMMPKSMFLTSGHDERSLSC